VSEDKKKQKGLFKMKTIENGTKFKKNIDSLLFLAQKNPLE
jgi:hypothetical protein